MKSSVPTVRKHSKLTKLGMRDILKQVRDSEFEQQLHDRLELAEKGTNKTRLSSPRARSGSDMQKDAATKDAKIQELEAKLDAGKVTQKLAVTEALSAVEKERDVFANKLVQAKQDNEAALKLAEAKLDANEVAQKLAITEAVSEVEKERDELKSGLKQAELQKQLAETSTQGTSTRHRSRIAMMRLTAYEI